ncbi:DNA-binding LacI/PurR family transcriptional regulator [Geomicrobium halophilum]|uniref:DNA-binding LacI/PurR family transcriptional regulator n=1 Tax=Geomicrobium halophilum TaxID=549000 RepID=A0A841PZE3_9BACL|nr:LacI family DNA-binding transcriptional regulator [Geomicrobium halophilum]MBB6450022.1 DNA-binding LacI/PurR family transcriptional regulator [Geomicrobium halophilum]
MAVTIKDVAIAANVATSTVSRVLANSSKISPETARRVRKAIDDLNYHPNHHARSLANNSTKTIGLIMPSSAHVSFQNPFFPEVIRGISTEAHKKNYGLYLSTGQTDEEVYEEVKQMVVEKRVDGIILLFSLQNDQLIPFLMEEDFPFVLLGRPAVDHPEQVWYVNNDNVRTGRLVTEYLTLLKHERIGLILNRSDAIVTHDRMQGYREALERSNLPINDDYIVHYADHENGGKDAFIEIMSVPDPPTALIAEDLVVFDVLRTVQDLGIRVPEELSIVGFNNYMISELASPPMTSIDINIFELGVQSMALLFDRLENPNQDAKQRIVPHELIRRSSCSRLK